MYLPLQSPRDSLNRRAYQQPEITGRLSVTGHCLTGHVCAAGFIPIAGNWIGQGSTYSQLIAGSSIFDGSANADSAPAIATWPSTYLSASFPKVYGNSETIIALPGESCSMKGPYRSYGANQRPQHLYSSICSCLAIKAPACILACSSCQQQNFNLCSVLLGDKSFRPSPGQLWPLNQIGFQFDWGG